MCGIAGNLEFAGSRTPAAERIAELERMAGLLGHRGPDESGYFIDERAALAAVRLSIIDLEHGQQPMGDPGNRYWIVCNGEIYNYVEIRAQLEQRGHRFETRCDTEVALRAWIEWGEEAPARFDGGFAFVLYDRRERTAFLVRDRFGKRPLFYCWHGNALLFGSEMKALLARHDLALRWDLKGLAATFAKWTPVGSETPFEGVRQVPAGTILRVSLKGITERLYAEFPVLGDPINTDFEEAASQVASLLRDSVRMRLRSDVEVGVLLSGGLDSTVITHLIHTEQPGRLRSFSITFSDSQFDESADQDRVVGAFGLSHASLRISTGDIANSFRSALWHAEVPQFRTAFVPMFLLAQFIRDQGVKVVLSGEGADEIFLGYDIFKETRLRQVWSSVAPEERRARVRRLYSYLPHFSDANAPALEAVFARSSTGPQGSLFSHGLRLENGRFALRLLRTDEDGLDGLHAATAAVEVFETLSAVRKAQWIEFHTLLQGYLLSSQGDRMMFAHGVEPRCPFLSPAVVSYAAGLPEHYLLAPDDNEKHVLKRAFQQYLPREILAKPKQPYRAPDASSFLAPVAEGGGRFADWVEETVAERQIRGIEALEPEAVARLLAKLRRTPKEGISPREDQAFVLLLSLCVLDRQFIHRQGMSIPGQRPPLSRSVNLIGVPAIA
jgi:asparagine synthase (glutamine-hydrolysing)